MHTCIIQKEKKWPTRGGRERHMNMQPIYILQYTLLLQLRHYWSIPNKHFPGHIKRGAN